MVVLDLVRVKTEEAKLGGHERGDRETKDGPDVLQYAHHNAGRTSMRRGYGKMLRRQHASEAV